MPADAGYPYDFTVAATALTVSNLLGSLAASLVYKYLRWNPSAVLILYSAR